MNDAERLLSLLSIRPDWLAQCRQHLTNNPSLMSNTTAEQAIFSIFCHTDIISCCGDLPIIPDNIETLHKQRLFVSKPVILQIDKIDNISDRFDASKDDVGGINPIGRCNKLTLTDGHRHCIAIDFHSILQIYQQQGYIIKSGSKIALRNVLVRRSAFCLDADSVCLLGGNIENDGQSQIFRELIGFPTIVSTAVSTSSSSSRRAPAVSSSITVATTSTGIATNPAQSGPSGGRISAVGNGSEGSSSSSSSSRGMVDLTSSSSSSSRAVQSPPQSTAPLISYSSAGSSYNARPNQPSIGRNNTALEAAALPRSTTNASSSAGEVKPTSDTTVCLLPQPTLDLLLAEEQELMMIVDADPLTSFTSSTTPMVSPPPKSSSSSGLKHRHTTDAVDNGGPTLQNIQNICSNPMINAGIIRGFASRIYRCKLHTPKHSDNGERSLALLSRAFLRSYLAQSAVATSTILLEVIMEFHDGYRSIPVMLHPHLSCRFLALHLSTILNASDPDPPVDDTAPLAMEDILLCFQQFQGFFMASRYPLSSSRVATLEPYANGFADELRQMGDRFVRKFSQQSANSGGQLSNNGSQSQHQSQYLSGPGGGGGSTQSSQSSSPTSMLMLLDLATWDPVVAATSAGIHLTMSAKKRMRAETAEGQPTVLSDIGGGVTIESLIRQKQHSWQATE